MSPLSTQSVAAAALANKTTRIAWAMLSRGTNYQPLEEPANVWVRKARQRDWDPARE